MTRRLMLAVLAAMMMLLSACSGVPEHSDPVEIGAPPVGGDANDEASSIQPGGPEAGSPSDEIVRGFIAALTATDTSYSVAREFLAPGVRTKWTPSEEVTVIDPSKFAAPGAEEGQVQFTANEVAHVDEEGVYRLATQSFDYQFELVKVSGEWRIANPPDGLILDTTSFRTLYRDATIYFADPSGTRLVADVRYFRTGLQQRANRLVQALLDGPVSTLADGVRNELASPVKLRSAVTYRQGPITVDLTGLGQHSEMQRRIAAAQIVWTLGDLGPVEVRITNNGDPLDIPGVGEIQTNDDWDSFQPNFLPLDSSAYYVAGGAVHTDSTDAVPGPAGTGEYGITQAAVTLDGTRIATISSSGGAPVLRTGLINEPLSTVDLPGTTSLSSPTWGPSSDEFWVVRNGTEIVRVSSKGTSKLLDAPGLAALGEIRGISRSRAGARVAIVAGPPGAPAQLYLATITTSSDSVSLQQPQVVVGDLEVTDVSWRDARTLAFLARTPGGAAVSPYTMLVDQSQRTRLPVPVSGQPAGLAAAPDRPFLCSVSQSILRLEEQAWVSLVGGIAVSGASPFYPG